MRIPQLLTIALFLSLNFLFSQEQDKIQELEKTYKNSIDTLTKIKTLEKLWQLTVYDNEAKAIEYARTSITLSEQINNDKQLARAYERLGISYSNISDYENSNEAYTTASEINMSLGKNRRVGGLLINKGINFKDLGQLDSALHYVNKSEKYIDLSCCKDDSILLASYYGTKSNLYLSKSQHLLALNNAIKATELSQALNDSILYADNLQLVADNNESLGNKNEAIQYFKEALEIYKIKEDTYYECEVSRKLGVLYSNLNPVQNDSAAFYLNRSLSLAREINIPLLESMSLTAYSKYLLKKNDINKAESNFKKNEEIAESIKDTFGLSDIYLGLGKIALAREDYSKAVNYTNQSLVLKRKMGLLSGQADCTKQLSDINNQLGNYNSSLDYFKDYKKLSDSIYNKDKTAKFNELQVLFDTEKKATALLLKEEEIKTLNTKAKNDKLTKTLYGIGMFSFIAIAGLLYFGFKQRLKKNRIAREKQEEIFKQEIEFKKKELASQTLHLVQKNTFIQELKENLERIKKTPELFKVEFRRLVMLLKKESAEDKDWEVFKSYFSEVHNDFDLKIKEINPEVSEKEIRLSAFIRMNLSTKEIASMLNVLPDSVLKSKYRLKKKLNLSKEDDLTRFLNSI